jgi:hypothetical protein
MSVVKSGPINTEPYPELFTGYTIVPTAKNVILSYSIILFIAASSFWAAICIALAQSDLTLAAGYKRCITKGSFLVAFCSNWTVDFGHDNSTAFAGITLINSAAASGVFILFMLLFRWDCFDDVP